uniref:Methyltransferase n=1 Tax=viral metagenome TaxID=1070528 RepID=A0A6C0HH54_9ZZZZ
MKKLSNNSEAISYTMRLLTLEHFLGMFSKIPENLNTLAKFKKNAKVKTSRGIVHLREYIADKAIVDKDIEMIYENFVGRAEYLARFYKVSLAVSDDHPLSINGRVDAMPIRSINNDYLVVYKNIIRNMFYKDILQNTKSGLENIPSFLDVLGDFYLRGIIDYKILTPSSLHYMRLGRLGSVFSSYYFRASIMNPLVPFSINHSYLKGRRIFTPTLGWGSYCYGFLECPMVEEYVGVDVIPNVCKKTAEFAEKFYGSKKTTIFCEPSENLLGRGSFRQKYREYFDVVFFSPPYYRLEMYSGKNQSTEKYKSYEEWLEKYWGATMELCWWVLRPGGKMCYILSGYGSENTRGSYDLLGDMNHLAKMQFGGSPKVFEMGNKNANMTKHRETGEKIVVFGK